MVNAKGVLATITFILLFFPGPSDGQTTPTSATPPTSSPPSSPPSSPSSGLSGKPQSPGSPSPSSGGTAPFESVMLAYGSADHIARDILTLACGVDTGIGGNLIFYDAPSFANIQTYRGYLAQIEILKAAYVGLENDLNEQASAAVPPNQVILPFEEDRFQKMFIPGGVTEVANLLVQLATATTSQSASNITIPDTAFSLKLIHKLSTLCPSKFTTVIYPQLAVASDETVMKKHFASIAEPFTDMAAERSKVARLLKGKDASPEAQNFKDINTTFNNFIQSLGTVNQSTGAPQIVAIVSGYDLQEQLKQPNTWVLMEQVFSAGGTMQDRKNLISSLSTGDWISYSGGAVVGYALIQATCQQLETCKLSLTADVLRYRTPFSHMQRPTDTSFVREGDNFGDDDKEAKKAKEKAAKSKP